MDRKLLLNGHWQDGQSFSEVKSPWDGRLLNRVAQASSADAEQALTEASAARPRLQALSTGARRDLLLGIASGLKDREAELADVICDEAAKPMSLAKLEVTRARETFLTAAGELTHFGSEAVPVDFTSNQEGSECELRRFPAGVI